MPSKSSLGSNVLNRSPWQVRVRSKPLLDKQFAFNRQGDAEAYLQSLAAQGVKARLTQLETSFQLRVRRKGVRVQFITFDTWEEGKPPANPPCFSGRGIWQPAMRQQFADPTVGLSR